MIKKYPWIKYFLIFVFAAILIAAVIRVITPQTEEPLIPPSEVQKKNFDQSVSTYNNVEFVGSTSNIDLTNSVGIYSAQLVDGEEELDNLISTLVSLFNLVQDPELTDKEFYISDEYSLSRSYLRDELMLSRYTPPEVMLEQIANPPPTGINTQQAISRATLFVNSIFEEQQYVPQLSSIAYLEGMMEPHPSSEQNAHYAEISFAQQIDSLPIILEQELVAPIRVMVSNNYLIQKAVFRTKELNLQQISDAQLLTVEEAIDRLNQESVGSIVGFAKDDPTPYSLAQISSGTLEEVVLEYRYDPELDLVYPFYRFSGTLTNSQNQSLQADVIAPAIKVQL
jgi:hypothetical protein